MRLLGIDFGTCYIKGAEVKKNGDVVPLKLQGEKCGKWFRNNPIDQKTCFLCRLFHHKLLSPGKIHRHSNDCGDICLLVGTMYLAVQILPTAEGKDKD